MKQEEPMELTNEQKKTLSTIITVRYGSGLVGSGLGAFVAYKRNSTFLGYVGFILLGGMVVGGLGALITMPAANRLLLDIKPKNDNDTKNNDTPPIKDAPKQDAPDGGLNRNSFQSGTPEQKSAFLTSLVKGKSLGFADNILNTYGYVRATAENKLNTGAKKYYVILDRTSDSKPVASVTVTV
jgi:hypothetical protein